MAAIIGMTLLAGCGANADARSTATASTDARAAKPLPGATATAATLGIITGRARSLQLSLPAPFTGLTDEQLSALTTSVAKVGDRSITVTSTPLGDEAASQDEATRDVKKACADQKGSSVVITDVPDPSLVDCLIFTNASVVIDASGQPWSSGALNNRAPFLWASATAPADVAERVLLAQAGSNGLLTKEAATIIAGPDEETTRIAAAITTPTLTSAGLTPSTILVGSEASASPTRSTTPDVDQLTAASEKVATVGRTGLVRPLTPAMYNVLASSAALDSGTSKVLITSTSSPGRTIRSQQVPTVAARTSLLGWAPPSDGTATSGTPDAAADGTTASACRTELGKQAPQSAQLGAWSSIYRMCDAVNLVRLGLVGTDAPTAASFRDAVWRDPAAWKPAAVKANGWAANSFTGANLAQWFAWDPTCKPTVTGTQDGCFASNGPVIALTN